MFISHIELWYMERLLPIFACYMQLYIMQKYIITLVEILCDLNLGEIIYLWCLLIWTQFCKCGRRGVRFFSLFPCLQAFAGLPTQKVLFPPVAETNPWGIKPLAISEGIPGEKVEILQYFFSGFAKTGDSFCSVLLSRCYVNNISFLMRQIYRIAYKNKRFGHITLRFFCLLAFWSCLLLTVTVACKLLPHVCSA